MTQEMAACPLCSQEVPVTELRAHVAADTEQIRGYIISAIRKHNPQWVEGDGTCEKCWEHYREL